jgi:hypothetical protein
MESNQIIVRHLRLAFELVHDIKRLCSQGLNRGTTSYYYFGMRRGVARKCALHYVRIV